MKNVNERPISLSTNEWRAIPVHELTLEQFAANNIKKVVYREVYNAKRDCSNRTFISYYITPDTRMEIPLRNIKSRKEAIKFAYDYEVAKFIKSNA